MGIPENGREEAVDRCNCTYESLQDCCPSWVGDVGVVVEGTYHLSHDAHRQWDVEGQLVGRGVAVNGRIEDHERG